MNTRLTGKAFQVCVWSCTHATSRALSRAVTMTRSSTPAVKRPAFRCVTRRTLNSVFARERSISFCQIADLFEVACLRRREDPLTQPSYAVLDRTPVDRMPVQAIAVRSVHHSLVRTR